MRLNAFLERRFDILRLVDAHAHVAIGLGEFDEVGQCVHVGFRVAVAVKELLPLPHHAHVAVVQVHDLDRQAILLGRGQFLDAHLNARLAGDTGDGRIRMRKLDTQRVRQADPHRAQAAGIDPAPRLVELVELRGPHLVLAYVRGHVHVHVLGQFVERLDHGLRLDDFRRAVVLQAIAASPYADLVPPGLDRHRVRPLLARGKLAVHFLQNFPYIADDGHVHAHALGNRGRIDVDVDDLAFFLEEMLRVADHAVIETRTDGQQHVAVLHRHVGLIGAVHAEHADELRIGGRIAAQSHQRIGAGEAQRMDQLQEFRRRVAEHDAAAGVDHRALGFQQQLQRLPDLATVPLDHRVVRAHRHRLRIEEVGLRGLHVLGDIHQHRAGTAGGGEVERLLHRDREVLDVLDQEVVLDARARHADGVHFLECVLTDGVGRHLAGDDDHRDGVHVRRRDAGDRVGYARTKGKSMVSEEIALNPFLEANGMIPVETDLGEYIIQLRKEPPSHIIAPAFHLHKEQVEETFRETHTALDPTRNLQERQALVAEARTMLRASFEAADAGITGANFLSAAEGAAVIVTNEGNGDLTRLLPRTHIVLTGIEKVVADLDDVAVLLRLLTRSATGQEISSYVSIMSGPTGERPDSAFHVVLLDNGRSKLLGTDAQDVLRCIRCAACLNHCPIYGAIGGHAYGATYPGPIGAALNPGVIGDTMARIIIPTPRPSADAAPKSAR